MERGSSNFQPTKSMKECLQGDQFFNDVVFNMFLALPSVDSVAQGLKMSDEDAENMSGLSRGIM